MSQQNKTKQNNPGVLILSEMAGCAVELTDAIQINPRDIEEIEQAIVKALEMPEREQKNRINHMQAILSNQTIYLCTPDRGELFT